METVIDDKQRDNGLLLDTHGQLWEFFRLASCTIFRYVYQRDELASTPGFVACQSLFIRHSVVQVKDMS